MEFKYSTGFTSEIKAASDIERQLSISTANLDSLKKFIPKDVNLERNVDLLGVAFNAAVVNLFNKNGDGIESSMAVAVKDYFIHKPTNIEHNKKRVVGHIVESGFTSFGENNLMSDSEALEEFGPFNLALGAVIYKTVDPSFAEMVEASVDPSSDLYNAVSASWEIGFNDYYIAVGSKKLDEAEVITEEKKIKELSKYLKANEGEGEMEDGTPVFRLVVGDIYPLGIGFTSNPAAEVKGLVTDKYKKKDEEANAFERERINIQPDIFLKNYKKSENNISQVNKNTVNKINEHIFDMENQNLIKDIKEMLEAQASEHYSEEAVANIAKVVGDVIKEKSDEYEQREQAAAAEKAEADAAAEESKAQFEEIQKELEETKQQLQQITEAQEKQAAQQRFDLRMGAVDEAYELNDDDREILASEVRELDSEEKSFEDYQERLSVMWAHKNKEKIAEQEKAFQEKVEAEVAKRISESSTEESEKEIEVSQASEGQPEAQPEEVVTDEEVLDKIEEVEAEITNNNEESASSEESLREQFLKTFKRDNVTINY